METKHTPGPWSMLKEDPTIIQGRRNAKDPYMFTVAETFGGDEERIANARLVAAAPQLLHTVQDLLGILMNPDEITSASVSKGQIQEILDAETLLAEVEGAQ